MMGIKVKFWNLWILTVGLTAGLLFAPGAVAAPVACEVTSDKDMDPATQMFPTGSFRQMLINAKVGQCIDKTITFKVPKVTMNAPLGLCGPQDITGVVIQPGSGIAQVEVVVHYDSKVLANGCALPPPFQDCFFYLPGSQVTLRDMKFRLDPASKVPPSRGLCIDEDPAFPNLSSEIRLERSVFENFPDGGVSVSAKAYGVLLTQTTFHDSDMGYVVESDPGFGMPPPPIMGGSDEALHAVVDTAGAVKEYHLRGLSVMGSGDQNIVKTEFFESDGKTGIMYVKDCNMHNSKLISGKWNIECVLPSTIMVPYRYAVTITSEMGMTSMFTTGVIPKSVVQVPEVTPSTPQAPLIPPSPPIVTTNPPSFKEPASGGTGDASKPISVTATPSAGCSLMR